ncbi:hypothetical protein HSR121_1693 [Halapricum desulfuricans]|uniref:Uncharacterized protein n=1 Tax=Halapricum desulfuricans TaxID=2841257 RepID=A0A897MV77_9EURY|nr:hypothetical protein HSR121_1693 [Halapricum desulfuricans]
MNVNLAIHDRSQTEYKTVAQAFENADDDHTGSVATSRDSYGIIENI